jgi:hypothetical protein
MPEDLFGLEYPVRMAVYGKVGCAGWRRPVL